MDRRFQRLGQNLTLPLLLFPAAQVTPQLIALATVLPVASYVALHHFYLLPRRSRLRRECVLLLFLGESPSLSLKLIKQP